MTISCLLLVILLMRSRAILDSLGERCRVGARERWVSRGGSDSDELTLADIEADTGKGPAADLSDCTFHASTEDFLAALKALRNGSTS